MCQTVQEAPLARTVEGFQPEQVLLNYHSPTSVWVSWSTGNEYSGSGPLESGPAAEARLDPDSIGSVVTYGAASLPSSNVTGSDRQVYTQVPINSSLVYSSPIIHHVQLENLLPNQTYTYSVGDGGGNSTQALEFMTTGLQPPTSTVRVGVVADMGATANSSETLAHLKQSDPQLVWLIGDATYADDYQPDGQQAMSWAVHGTYQPRWSGWQRMVSNLFSRIPMLMIPGNHEIEAQADGQPEQFFASYLARFRGPYNSSHSQLYYSTDVGAAHVVMLNPYANQPNDYQQGTVPHDPQLVWLKEDLKAFNRKKTPFLIVGFHTPIYNTYINHFKELECWRQAVEYERMNRVHNYTVDACGITHITVGDAGNLEQLARVWVDDAPDGSQCPMPRPAACPTYQSQDGMRDGEPSFCPQHQPEWSAFREASFGHGTLEISPDRLKWAWFRNHGGQRMAADEVTKEREAQIDRINEQVRDLYGPLLACVTASKSAFDAMVRQHSPDGTKESFIQAVREDAEGKEAQAYRHWMKEVLQPLNDKAADAITNHIDLLESAEVEPLLLKLMAYVKTTKVLMSRWEAGNLNEWSSISYPDGLLDYVQREFKKIKQRQAALLGVKNGDEPRARL
eukprot:jgi/Astpho2/9937/Aster-06643